eukprot:gene17625-19379_t
MAIKNKSAESNLFGLFENHNQRILIVDELLMSCDVCDHTFIPEENLDFDDLICSLKARLLNPESPTYHNHQQRGGGRFARKSGHSFDNENKHYNAFYKNRHLKSDGVDTMDEEIWYTPTKQRNRSTSIPNSVLLQITPRKSSSLQESFSEDDDVFAAASESGRNMEQLRKRFVDQISWVKERGDDYVALETLDSVDEIMILLRIFLNLKTPAALGFKVNHNQTITVSYQFLKNFNKDFMMLKVGENYRVFMSPF